MFNIVLGYLADQVAFTDWAKDLQVSAKNLSLYSLNVVNKGSDCWVQLFDSASGASGNPREYPLLANSILTVTNKRFGNGLYVRAVTAADGSTLIAGNDVQIDAAYMTGPVS